MVNCAKADTQLFADILVVGDYSGVSQLSRSDGCRTIQLWT